jgi:hypothetical protein
MKNENVRKYGVVYFLILIVVIMSIIKIKYGWKNGENPPPPTATPTETISATPTVATGGAEVLKVDVTKYPLWDQLPYSGDGFLIDKYVAPKTLAVQLSSASSSSATKAINVWLKGFGGAGKGHKIEFEN